MLPAMEEVVLLLLLLLLEMLLLVLRASSPPPRTQCTSSSMSVSSCTSVCPSASATSISTSTSSDGSVGASSCGRGLPRSGVPMDTEQDEVEPSPADLCRGLLTRGLLVWKYPGHNTGLSGRRRAVGLWGDCA